MSEAARMTKYTKFGQMVHEMLLTEDKAIPRIASSKSSDQKTLDIKYQLRIFYVYVKYGVSVPTLKICILRLF